MNTGERQRKQLDDYANPLNPNDPEFAAKVRSKIGTPYRDLVDPRVAAVINPGDSYNLLGINSHRVPDEKRSDFAQRMSMGLGQINANSYNDFLNPEKHVYGIGNGASPQTMAHEYRHDKIKDESANRLMDFGKKSETAIPLHGEFRYRSREGRQTARARIPRDQYDDRTRTFRNRPDESKGILPETTPGGHEGEPVVGQYPFRLLLQWPRLPDRFPGKCEGDDGTVGSRLCQENADAGQPGARGDEALSETFTVTLTGNAPGPGRPGSRAGHAPTKYMSISPLCLAFTLPR